MDLKDIVVVSGARTPMGKFGGTLKDLPAYTLGARAISEALKRANIEGNIVNDVIFGNCRQAGNYVNPAHSAAAFGGIPAEAPSLTLNMACPSGMRSIALASQAIRLGEAEVVMAGGMDSMSTIPYLLKGARFDGFKWGNKTIEDGWSDSQDPVQNFMGMGDTAETLAEKYGISREDQDQYAAGSHKKAAKARSEGWFKGEIVPVEIPQRKGEPLIFAEDESIREDTSAEKLAKLPAAFKKGGTVTAGNACGMTDGAVALVVMSREKAKALGLKPLFSLVSYAQIAVDGATMGEGPAHSIPAALKKVGMTLANMDAIEVNEAFAVQVLANEKVLQWDREKVNRHGGAIALGHPTGISGARIVLTLYHVLRIQGGELGVAAICGGGGVSTALIIRREN